MAYLKETECCGLREIDDLSLTKPATSMIQICYDFFESMDSAFIVFTGVTKELYGRKFKKFILDNKLGTVIETESKRNPNSGNRIKTWIWTVNITKLKSWFKKNKNDLCIEHSYDHECECKECSKKEKDSEPVDYRFNFN